MFYYFIRINLSISYSAGLNDLNLINTCADMLLNDYFSFRQILKFNSCKFFIFTKVSGSWSYITAPTKGWVSTAYLSSTKVVADKPKKVTYKTTVGKHYRLKGKTYLCNSHLSAFFKLS